MLWECCRCSEGNWVFFRILAHLPHAGVETGVVAAAAFLIGRRWFLK